MRRYETTYILRPNLGEEQFTEIIERTNAIVTDDDGSIFRTTWMLASVKMPAATATGFPP